MIEPNFVKLFLNLFTGIKTDNLYLIDSKKKFTWNPILKLINDDSDKNSNIVKEFLEYNITTNAEIYKIVNKSKTNIIVVLKNSIIIDKKTKQRTIKICII